MDIFDKSRRERPITVKMGETELRVGIRFGKINARRFGEDYT